jgi:hypothetical protein
MRVFINDSVYDVRRDDIRFFFAYAISTKEMRESLAAATPVLRVMLPSQGDG